MTSGTVFQDTKLPLMLWFRALWLVTNQKSGVSAAPFRFFHSLTPALSENITGVGKRPTINKLLKSHCG